MRVCEFCFTGFIAIDAHGNEICPNNCGFIYDANYFPVQNGMNFNFERHFTDLKAKYLGLYVTQHCSSAQLYHILLRLEHGPAFNDEEIEWLKNRSLFPIIANIYFQRHQCSADGWNLAKACSYYRKAGFPQIGIQITNQYPANDNKPIAAILTTRGAAFKDLKDLLNAEKCANVALSYNRTKYPLTLLGAIYYLYGRYTEGDEFFNEAERLGASTDAHDREIKTAVESAEVVDRKIIAQHLIHKDPNRYSWAETYIEQ